jgi:hypothetical protein
MKEKSTRPSPFTVVEETLENGLKPPRKFGPAGESLWIRVQNEYAVGDVGGLELLTQCCMAADRAEALAAIIEADGERIVTKSGPRAHPCIREETSVRAFICRTLQRLGITDEPVKPMGRPAKGFGWKGDAD